MKNSLGECKEVRLDSTWEALLQRARAAPVPLGIFDLIVRLALVVPVPAADPLPVQDPIPVPEDSFYVKDDGMPRTRITEEIADLIDERGSHIFSGDMVAVQAGNTGPPRNIWVFQVQKIYKDKKKFKLCWYVILDVVNFLGMVLPTIMVHTR